MHSTGPGIVLHVPGPMSAADGSGLHGFLAKLFEGFAQAGARVELRTRDFAALEAMGDTPDFHIVWQGHTRHPRLLNTAVGYIFPFWYLDPAGVYGASSLTDSPFEASTQDPTEARAFFDRLHKRLVVARKSRLPQPDDHAPLPDNAIAIFLQGWSEPTERLRHMTEPEMVAAVLADTGGRPVIAPPADTRPRNL